MNYQDMTAQDLKECVLKGDETALHHLVDRASKKERTGLLNEYDFPIEIRKEEERVRRGQSIGGIVMNIDLAGFKRLNDTYGYDEGGNKALKELAKFLRNSNFREIDIVANPGGDEFFIILTNTKLDIPDFSKLGKQPVSDEFKKSCSPSARLWFRLEQFARDARVILFDGVDKNKRKYMDFVRGRITFSAYGDRKHGARTLTDAIEHSKKLEDLQKKLTNEYIIGGR